MTNLSRRSVAKGAAWSVPTVAMASAAPALAASSTNCTYSLSCPSNPMHIQTGGTTSLTIFIRDLVASTHFSGGTSFGINLGQWVVDTLPTFTAICGGTTTTKTATGFYINWGTWGGSCSASPGTGSTGAVTNGDGTSYQGYLNSSSPFGCSPQVAGAGVTESVRLETTIPYDLFGLCQSAHNLGKVSLPFTLTFLDGLTPVASCHYNLNLQFKTGCQPNQLASGYTITAA